MFDVWDYFPRFKKYLDVFGKVSVGDSKYTEFGKMHYCWTNDVFLETGMDEKKIRTPIGKVIVEHDDFKVVSLTYSGYVPEYVNPVNEISHVLLYLNMNNGFRADAHRCIPFA